MTLISTLVAHCDGKVPSRTSWHRGHPVACRARVTLDAHTSQPFRDLTDLGWSNEIVDDDTKSFCPECTQRRARTRPTQEDSADA